jgi:hypothetical protein
MKSTLVFLALVACSITQAHAVTAGSAAAAVAIAASSASAARSKAMAATSARSDCGACHQEVFPFTAVKVEEMFSEDDCFAFKVERIPYYEPEVLVFTRHCGKVKRVYRLSQKPQKYMAKRYFLPADKETFNPHYILKEDEE